jgi:hypothetical protein
MKEMHQFFEKFNFTQYIVMFTGGQATPTELELSVNFFQHVFPWSNKMRHVIFPNYLFQEIFMIPFFVLRLMLSKETTLGVPKGVHVPPEYIEIDLGVVTEVPEEPEDIPGMNITEIPLFWEFSLLLGISLLLCMFSRKRRREKNEGGEKETERGGECRSF